MQRTRNPQAAGIAHSSGEVAEAYDSDPQDTAGGQLLTVVSRPGQSLSELTLLYAGRNDSGIVKRLET